MEAPKKRGPKKHKQTQFVPSTDDIITLTMDDVGTGPTSAAASAAPAPAPASSAAAASAAAASPAPPPVRLLPRADMELAFKVVVNILDKVQKAGGFHMSESYELWRAIQVLNTGIDAAYKVT